VAAGRAFDKNELAGKRSGGAPVVKMQRAIAGFVCNGSFFDVRNSLYISLFIIKFRLK